MKGHDRQSTRTNPRREVVRWLTGLALTGATAPLSRADGPMRMIVSEKLVTGVSMNDARAAMLIWIKRVSADTGLLIDVPQQLFGTSAEIGSRLRQGTVDAVAITAPEYREMSEYLDRSQVVIQGDSANRQYVIAVKKSRANRTLSGLAGGRLLSLQGPSTCLSQPWLVTLLARERLGDPDRFFASNTPSTKAAQVILPVFFGHADACLTTSRSLHTMAELNPQISQQLEVIATSPVLTPSFHIFRKNYHGAEREKLMAALTGVLSNPAGRQIKTMFQFDGLVVRSGDSLTETMAMLEAAGKVTGRSKS